MWWLPIYFLAVGSVKPNEQNFSSPFALPSRIDFGVYSQAWKGSGNGTLGRSLESSLIITIASIVALIVLGSLAAYVVARASNRLGNGLYLLFVLGIILPFQLAIIPTYSAFRHIHLVGNYAGMVVLWTGLLMPLTVFLYTGFIRALPRDYEEAARVDGATRMRTFVRVVFPLLRPVTGTVAILTGLIVWNDFFLSLVFLSGTKNVTLPVTVYSYVGVYASQWNLIFATVVVSVVPMLAFYLFAQKNLIRGFTGGIKT
ncbi:MAG TPA: carbohydrate ABC transporter permease [Gaiellaceae bacterium]|nr:carbohydrate ABC transporter permease [Gaiellaceae bacterium]